MKRIILSTVFAAAVVSGPAFATPYLVSSDSDGNPLVEVDTDSSIFKVNDITPDGRFVLFTSSETCSVYRKDRETGELLTVFENTLEGTAEAGSGYSWCNGAGISADGNIVAASPSQYLAEPVISCDPEDCAAPDATIAYSFGDVVEVVQKNLTTDAVVELSREYTTGSAGDISRIEVGGGCCYDARFEELSANGETALISRFTIGGYDFVTYFQQFAVVDITAATITDIASSFEATTGEQAYVRLVNMDETGDTLLLSGQLIEPIDPGELPDECNGDSWWGLNCPLQTIRSGLWLYATESGDITNIYTVEDRSAISLTDISGNGEYVFFVLQPPLCYTRDFEPCPVDPEAEVFPKGLQRLHIATSGITPIENACPTYIYPGPADSALFKACLRLQSSDDGSTVLLGMGEIFSSFGPVNPGIGTGPLDPCLYPGAIPDDEGCTGGDRTDIDGGGQATGPGAVLLCGQVGRCDRLGLAPVYNGQIEGTGDLPDYLPKINLPSFIRANWYVPAPYDWFVADVATGAVDIVSIADGIKFSTPTAILAGDGADWAFTSEQTLPATGWLQPGAAYADVVRPPVDLAIVTKRKSRQDDAAATGYKTIISNYSDVAANLVQLRLRVSGLDETVGAPALALRNYDACDVYDNTTAIRGASSENISFVATPDPNLGKNKRELICAIGMLPAGGTITINWQIDPADDPRYVVRSSVSGAEFDPQLYNNSDKYSSGGGGSSAFAWLLLPLWLLGALRSGRRYA